MYRDDEVLTAIRQKDVGTIVTAFFSRDLSIIMPYLCLLIPYIIAVPCLLIFL